MITNTVNNTNTATINHHIGVFVNTDVYVRSNIYSYLADMRGLICIDRMFNGKLTTFPIVHQSGYRGYSGCYSLI